MFVREQAAHRGSENCKALRDESGSADERSLLLCMVLERAHKVSAGQVALGSWR